MDKDASNKIGVHHRYKSAKVDVDYELSFDCYRKSVQRHEQRDEGDIAIEIKDTSEPYFPGEFPLEIDL